jgi:Bacterial Ig-like domain (group 3)
MFPFVARKVRRLRKALRRNTSKLAAKQLHFTRLWVEPLEDRLVPSTLTWTGTNSNLWSDSGNWLQGQAPQAGDSLVFPGTANSMAPVNDISGLSVGGLEFDNGYSLSGQAISLAGNINVTAGNSTFGADASITGGLNSVTIATGASLTFQDTLTLQSGVTLGFISGTAMIAGTLTVPLGTTVQVGNGVALTLNSGAKANVSGVFVDLGAFLDDGTLTDDGSMSVAPSGTFTVNASGTLIIDPSGILTDDGIFTDNGAVTEDNGGQVNVDPGANWNIDLGGTFDGGGTVTDAGTITDFSGAVITVPQAGHFDVAPGGKLEDNGQFVTDGSTTEDPGGQIDINFNTLVSAGWAVNSGGTFDAGGTVTEDPGGQIDIKSGANWDVTSGGIFDAGGTVVAAGTITDSSGAVITVPQAGHFDVAPGGKLEDDGQFFVDGSTNEDPGAQIDINTLADWAVNSGGTFDAGGTVVAAGTITDSSGAVITVPQAASFNVQSTGSLTDNGTFNVGGTLLEQNGGHVNVDSGANWNIDLGGITALSGVNAVQANGTVTVNADGTLAVNNGGTLTADGVMAVTGSLSINGVVTVSLDGTLTVAPNGSVTDATNLVVNGTMTVNGDGTITVTPSGSCTDAGNMSVDSGGKFTDNGTVTQFPLSTFDLQGNAQVNVDGGLFHSTSATWQADAGSTTSLENGGNLVFDNIGFGHRVLAGDVTMDGGLTEGAGTSFSLGLFDITSFGAASSLNVLGNFNMNSMGGFNDLGNINLGSGGTLNDSGSLNVGGSLTTTPGSNFSMTGNGSADFSGSVNIGGIFDPPPGTSLTLSGTAAMTIESTGSLDYAKLTLKNTSSLTVLGSLIGVSGSMLSVADTASLVVGGAGTVNVQGAVNVAGGASLQLQGSGALQLQSAAALTDTGTVAIQSSATLDDAGSATVQTGASLTDGGALIVETGATLSDSGAIQVQSTGTLTDAGAVSVASGANLDFASGATLSMPLDGLANGASQQAIADSGEMTIAGATLNVQLPTPASVGANFTVIQDLGNTPVTGQFQGVINVGGQPLTLSYVGGAGHDVVLQVAGQATPTFSVSDAGGTYNGSLFSASYTLNGIVNGSLEGVTPTLTYYSGATATGTALPGAPSAAGTYTVVASFPGSTDYASASAQMTFSIAQATPTVGVSDAGGTYNGAAFPATATVAGVVAGVDNSPAPSLEGVAPGLTYYAGPTASGTPLAGAPTLAGTYTVVASFAGSSDYASASAQATFTIAQATPTINVGDAGGTYNGAPFPATANMAGVVAGVDNSPAPSLEGVTPGLTYYAGPTASGTPLAGAPTLAGTYTVVASFAGSSDYASASAQATFTIAQATPTVSVSDAGGTYNGAPFPATATVAGVVAGVDNTPAPSLEGVSPGLTYYAGPTASGTPLAGAPTLAGTYTVVASFAGSTDYASASAQATFTIAQANTSTTVVSSANPVGVGQTLITGQAVSFTATVGNTDGTSTQAPTGTIQFMIDGANFGNAVAPSGSGKTATAVSGSTTFKTSDGTHTITAHYVNADGNFAPGADGSTTLAATKASTSISDISTPNPSTYGNMVAFTATVSVTAPGSTSAGKPTGTVDFVDTTTSTDLTPGGVTLTAGGTASFTTTATQLKHGSHVVVATYSGDSNFSGSNDGPTGETQVVNPDATSASVAANPASVVTGQAVTFTATITNTDATSTQTPTGTIQFMIDGANFGNPVALSGSSKTATAVSVSTRFKAADGTHTITAHYVNSDGNFTPGSDGSTSLAATQDATVTVVKASVNPSVFGQVVTFTAIVRASAPGSGTLTGMATFKDGTTVMGSGALNSSSQATFSTTALARGAHSISVSYGGDSNFTSNVSGAYGQVVTRDATTTAVSSSPAPSVFGQLVTFTAMVSASAPGAGTPTGGVTFKEGATVLGSGTLQVMGGMDLATFSTRTLAVGSHTITASYPGDNSFSASLGNDSAAPQVVDKDGTSMALRSSVNPSVFGQTVTFTASVHASTPGSGIPTGMVTFKDGSVVLGSGALNSAGQATFSTATLSRGGHAITAAYGGDGSFLASSSIVFGQGVNRDATVTSLTSSANPSVALQAVTFTAIVMAKAPGAGQPTGAVVFKDGATVLGSRPLQLVGGKDQATFSTASLGVGIQTITATYVGDNNFLSGASGPLIQTVNAHLAAAVPGNASKFGPGNAIAPAGSVAAGKLSAAYVDSYFAASSTSNMARRMAGTLIKHTEDDWFGGPFELG